MTDQEIFDKVALHLLTQGRPARESGSCKYRTPGGRKCAIGCLIEDDQYTPKMEGLRISQVADRYYSRLRNILNKTSQRRKFLGRLQSTHDFCELRLDGAFDKADLLSQLRSVAEDYRLSASILDTQP
jgi:hypothetical protein